MRAVVIIFPLKQQKTVMHPSISQQMASLGDVKIAYNTESIITLSNQVYFTQQINSKRKAQVFKMPKLDTKQKKKSKETP